MSESFRDKRRLVEELGNFIVGATINFFGEHVRPLDEISSLITGSIGVISAGITCNCLSRKHLINGRIDAFGSGVLYVGYLVSACTNQFIRSVTT